jgi:hypothetical protein
MADELPSQTEQTESTLPSDFENMTWQEIKKLDPNVLGSYKTPKDLVENHKKTIDLYSQEVNRNKTYERTQQERLEREQKQTQIIEELVPKFVENGMNLTDEMIEKFKSVGLDEKDVKLKAYEYKETVSKKINEIVSWVGGEDNYKSMITWANTLPKEEQIAYNEDLKRGSKFAVIGMYNEYQKALKGGYNRIIGDKGGIGSEGGYKSKQELLKDKRYVDSHPHDKSAKEIYLRKLQSTEKSIYS